MFSLTEQAKSIRSFEQSVDQLFDRTANHVMALERICALLEANVNPAWGTFNSGSSLNIQSIFFHMLAKTLMNFHDVSARDFCDDRKPIQRYYFQCKQILELMICKMKELNVENLESSLNWFLTVERNPKLPLPVRILDPVVSHSLEGDRFLSISTMIAQCGQGIFPNQNPLPKPSG